MLNNLKIGTRLGIGFGITLVMLVLVAIVGFINIQSLEKQTNELTNADYPKATRAFGINISLNRTMRKVLLQATSAEDEDLSTLDRDSADISGHIDYLESTIFSDTGKAALRELQTARQAFLAQSQQVRSLLERGLREEAINSIHGPFQVAFNNYVEAVRTLQNLQDERVVEAGEEAEATAVQAEILMAVLSLIAILLTLATAFFATRSITKPINEAVNVANQIAEGDLSMDIKATAKDEVGQMLQALAKAVNAVKNMAAEAKHLAKAAVEGKLDTRADASQYKGEYKNIVIGVNNTLDAVIGPLNVAADYVDRISRGDIPEKITDSYNGDFNKIKNNLNVCIDAVNLLVSDAEMLSKAAVEGKLATRADATRHQGDFRAIVEGVNDTLDAVIGPLNVAADYVDRISRGDIPPKITDSYNGDFNKIKNNLNVCIEAVNLLVADANMLAK
ncbi:MAG: MCP four helix bundle domain-containing protein, partial [Wenzhouxiangellaceae bacterium]|nr:MCP four helix bundle domain-containing protein [Wenzhouxiangellaceae bacterium]